MQLSLRLPVLAVIFVGVAAGNAKANPLATVIELMDQLTAKLIKDGDAEAKAFVAFTEWCDDASKNFNFALKTSTTAKGKLEAKIGELTGTIDSCTSKIESLANNIASDEKDLNDATLVRNKEVADFQASESELVQTVDTLSRAISLLEREMAKNPAAFTQVDTSSLDGVLKSLNVVVDAASFSVADKQRLSSLVQAQQEDDEPGAPAAAAYKTHSTNILDVLEDLKEKAEEQLSTLRKEETNTKHNFDMLKQSLEAQIAADSKEKQEETADKAAATEAKATAEGDLTQTIKDLKENKASLATSNSDCMSVAADHDATLAARKEELKVIATAKKMLQDTSSGAVGETYSFFQGLRTRSDLAGAEVVTVLKQLAKKHDSAALSQLASHVSAVMQYGASAGEDPFIKVKGLIQAMIEKLTKTMNEEADEKAYCDEQMAKTEEKQTELEDDVSRLTSKIDQASATSATLKGEVGELQGELAALAKLQAEMDKVRAEEHAAYLDAKADLELGLKGVRQALGVLRDYYGGAAGASMLQSGFTSMMEQPEKPELHSKSSGAGGSIIDILEVVESDFAKNLAQEEGTESDAAAEYEKTTQENAVAKTTKVQDVKYKTMEFIRLDKEVAELSADLKSTSTELAAVNDYYGKIKSKCIAKPETYEERRKARAEEIKGLKEALAILENEVAFTQRRKRSSSNRFLGF